MYTISNPGIYLSSLWSSRPPLLLLLFIFILRIPNAELCQRHTTPVPKKLPEDPSETRYINLYFLSDHSHCQLFENIGDQRLYMMVLANGIRATLSGLPPELRLVLRLVGISCLTKSEQDSIYETSIKKGWLIGESGLWGLKKYVSQNQTQFENATVIVVLTAFNFGFKRGEKFQAGYSFPGEFCSTSPVALISDPDAMYRRQDWLAEHIFKLMGINFEFGLLAKCARKQTESDECSFEKLDASLARISQECFRPRGQEVSEVTSLPGDVVDLRKLCKAMYSKKEKIDYCVQEEITGLDRFESVYNCELRCCIGKGGPHQVSYITDSLQGLRCGKVNKFCINGICYNRQDWIDEYLPKGSVDIRPDVPPKGWVG